MSLNRVTVIGYLGQDPQLRYTSQGTPVCTLSVATDESYTNKQSGERKEAVQWHRVVVWGKQGSICAERLATAIAAPALSGTVSAASAIGAMSGNSRAIKPKPRTMRPSP